jgi:hypothetical protein
MVGMTRVASLSAPGSPERRTGRVVSGRGRCDRLLPYSQS